MSKKQKKQQELQKIELAKDKLFNKQLLISFSIALSLLISVQVFYTYRCETLFTLRKYTLYENEISPDNVCQFANKLRIHKTMRIQINKLYLCSNYCKEKVKKNFDSASLTTDAFSHETIEKTKAIIGLKTKGKAEVVYFKNKQNFINFYKNRD